MNSETNCITYNGILFSNKREWLTDTHNNADEDQNDAELKKKPDPNEKDII